MSQTDKATKPTIKCTTIHDDKPRNVVEEAPRYIVSFLHHLPKQIQVHRIPIRRVRRPRQAPTGAWKTNC